MKKKIGSTLLLLVFASSGFASDSLSQKEDFAFGCYYKITVKDRDGNEIVEAGLSYGSETLQGIDCLKRLSSDIETIERNYPEATVSYSLTPREEE